MSVKKNQLSKKIKIGILGAGGIVQMVHLPVLCSMPDIQISWICDVVREAAKSAVSSYVPSAKAFTNIEDCPDVDIVLVAIPVGYRNDPLHHILSRGWNVFCEKPFAVSLADHDRLIEQASANDVQIGVGLMRRYYRGNIIAKKLIASGILGDIQQVHASQGMRVRGTGRDNWYQADKSASGGGVLIETGSHLIDQLFTILDVTGFQVTSCRQQFFDNLDFETNATAVLSTSGQEEIKFTLGLSNLRDLYSGIVIQFSTCVLKLGLFPRNRPALCDLEGRPQSYLEGDTGANDAISEAFYLEWRDFITQCSSSDGYKSAVDAVTARQSTAFLETCYQISQSTTMEIS